jgi:hypothetical protein
MVLGRILGWLLILAAFAVAASEAYAWLDQGSYHITAAGELWYRLSPKTFTLLEPAVQRHLYAPLWDYVFRPFFLLPAWLVLGVLGILFLLIFRRHPRKRRHSSSFG